MSEIELAAPHTALPSTTEWETMLSMANAIAKTEFVPKGLRGRPDATLAAIMFGREIGLPPMVAMSSVHIIEGHPTMSAHLLLALIRRAGHSIIESDSTRQRATITAKRGDNGEQMTVEFTVEEAQQAGLGGKDNWKKYPNDMLWARCVSRLYRRLFSDVTFGASVYVPEDFGVDAPDAAEASVFTDAEVADMGVMQGISEFVPRPEDGKPMGQLVKKEILHKVMRDQNLPKWDDCTPVQQQEAITLSLGLIEIARAKLGFQTIDELTFEQARDVLSLVRDGTMPEVEEPEVIEPEEIAPSGPVEDVVDAEEVSPVDEALAEQRWVELTDLLSRDLSQGTNSDIETKTRKLYRLMGELELWPDDQLHTDLAKLGHAHYRDLGKKADYQTFANGARVLAQQRVLEVGRES